MPGTGLRSRVAAVGAFVIAIPEYLLERGLDNSGVFLYFGF